MFEKLDIFSDREFQYFNSFFTKEITKLIKAHCKTCPEAYSAVVLAECSHLMQRVLKNTNTWLTYLKSLLMYLTGNVNTLICFSQKKYDKLGAM